MYINKMLTKVNFKNTNNINRIEYLVIHYVGATGDAEANCKYFYEVSRDASAHYFIGHSGDIWQCVEDADIAFHCGSRGKCNNSNSIGIELCCKKDKSGKWYFEDKTVKAAIELAKSLMEKYKIPVDKVIRHYDVTKKICPEPYVRDNAAWLAFKSALAETATNDTLPFGIKINCDALNIRSGIGTAYKITGVIRDKKTYTIVEVNNGWGRLKSGIGWINLNYTNRV